MDDETNLETKAGPANAGAADQLLRLWEEFKSANDERLNAVEKRLSADVLLTEKVDRLNRAMDTQKQALDDLALGARRPQLETGTKKGTDPEHKGAWDAYMRKGDLGGLARLELKSLTGQAGPDGGYLLPSETESMVDRLMAKISPVRAIASVRQISAASFKKPFATAGAGAGWVGDAQSRPETASPTLSVLEFPAMELYAMPAATQALLDDANVCAIKNADGGWEVLQFTTAELTAPLTYKLSGLLRGQAGTEAEMRNPITIGAPFVLITPALLQLAVSASDRNRDITWRYGPADVAVEDVRYINEIVSFKGVGERPLSPVHIQGRRDSATNDVTITWIRRTRIGGDVWDGGDVALSEAAETYQVEILNGVTVVRTLTATSPQLIYTAAQQIADLGSSTVSPIDVRIVQTNTNYGPGQTRTARLYV